MKLPPVYTRALTLGSGNSGTVVRVHRDDIGEYRVLKIFHPPREAKAESGGAPNPSAPMVYGAFRHRGRSILEMEWIQGVSLAQLRQQLRFDPEVFAVQILWILRALDALHRTTIHGDIKPDHVIFCPSGEVRWIDLGFSSSVHAPRALGGSPRYLHPELAVEGALPAPHHDLQSVVLSLRDSLGEGESDQLAASLPRLRELLFQADPVDRDEAEGWKDEVAGICRPFATDDTEASLRSSIGEAFRASMNLACKLAARKEDSLFHLQEALDWDPDDRESLALVGVVGARPTGTRKLAPVAAISLAIAGIAAFAIQYMTDSVSVADDPAPTRIFQPVQAAQPSFATTTRVSDSAGSFRETSAEAKAGRLRLVGFDACTVTSDGSAIPHDTVTLPSGIHHLRWTCGDHRRRGSRVINLPSGLEVSVER